MQATTDDLVRPDAASGAVSAIAVFHQMVDEFAALVAKENALLSGGMPAALIPTVRSKEALAARLRAGWQRALVACAHDIAAAPETRQGLAAAARRLRTLAEDNRAKIVAAQKTARRRIEAVMSALRQQIEQGQPYGQAARVIPPTSRPYRANLQT